jgi:CopG family nickel-responsive transcriptional regulator
MERVTISMSDEFAAELAAFMDDNRYENRSEAVRDLARLGLKQRAIERGVAGPCVATLSYVYDHHARKLPQRLTDAHHERHDLQVATMHVHLDADICLEVAVLRGDAAALRDFSKAVIAERGVTHGQISFAPIASHDELRSRDAAGRPHRHAHSTS